MTDLLQHVNRVHWKMHSHEEGRRIAAVQHPPTRTGVHLADKAVIAAWIRENIAARDISQRQIAIRINVSPSTLSRWCDPEDPTMPRWENVNALAEVFGSAPPGSVMPEGATGFHEPSLQLLPDAPRPGEEWNGNITTWRVKDNSMQVAGYLKGDEIRCDARIKPLDGDTVIANIYSPGGEAETVLRLYKAPGYLVPASYERAHLEVHEIGKNAAIFGVVFETTRRRAAH